MRLAVRGQKTRESIGEESGELMKTEFLHGFMGFAQRIGPIFLVTIQGCSKGPLNVGDLWKYTSVTGILT